MLFRSQFDLTIMPDQVGTAVAASGTFQGTTNTTGNLRPDEMVTSPLENNSSASTASPPETTDALIAMLSGGGGIDMSVLNSSGSFSTESQQGIGLAGSTGGRSGLESSGVASQADALGREIMVFSDMFSEVSTHTATGSESYS